MTGDRIRFPQEFGCTVLLRRQEFGILLLLEENLNDRGLGRVRRRPSQQRRYAPFKKQSYRNPADSTITGYQSGVLIWKNVSREKVSDCISFAKNDGYFTFPGQKILPGVWITLKTMLHAQKVVCSCHVWLNCCGGPRRP